MADTFGDTGLGFIVNMTVADGSATFNNLSDEPQFALELSDTRNVVLFAKAMARRQGCLQLAGHVLYRWRNATRFCVEQWDASAHEVGDGFTVFVKGINLTDSASGPMVATHCNFMA